MELQACYCLFLLQCQLSSAPARLRRSPVRARCSRRQALGLILKQLSLSETCSWAGLSVHLLALRLSLWCIAKSDLESLVLLPQTGDAPAHGDCADGGRGARALPPAWRAAGAVAAC